MSKPKYYRIEYKYDQDGKTTPTRVYRRTHPHDAAAQSILLVFCGVVLFGAAGPLATQIDGGATVWEAVAASLPGALMFVYGLYRYFNHWTGYVWYYDLADGESRRV